MTPEDRARTAIDALLRAAGWDVVDYGRQDISKPGVAIREFPLTTGFADYLLYVNGEAVGAVEAKRAGTTLSTVAEQSQKYLEGLKAALPSAQLPLPFAYESTGTETYFRDERDPDARSRRVFAFHRPETLAAWLREPDTLRARLRALPALDTAGLRQCQVEALTGLEASLARDDPRALVQMATGSGKSYTAVSLVYRLAKHARLGRGLFLVDRTNLGRQIETEFATYRTPDTHRLFTSLYPVQRLTSGAIDPEAKVVISTIQRVCSLLRGDDLDARADDVSAFEAPAGGVPTASGNGSASGAAASGPDEDVGYTARRTVEVAYNPEIPPETFDLIVVDECHRSIYNVWRQVLEYFDARVVGLTATPSATTVGFFHKNLVSEYGHARAVADDVNVPFDVWRIRTEITERGATVEQGNHVYKRDRRTRAQRQEVLDEDTTYEGAQLDRSVVSKDQIRTVLTAFRDALPRMFPGRTEVPKTLIFAKDDAHAEDVVHIVREVFGKGNRFAKKITYQAQDPEGLIKEFRQSHDPRIAVSVDMIATGTDIKPLEVLLFMRDVKSQAYFDQMKGRGTRVVSTDELHTVTPDAPRKDRFVLVDAVGVTETDKTATRPLDREPSVATKDLVHNVGLGVRDADTLSTLAARLDRLRRRLSASEADKIEALADRSLGEIIAGLVRAADPDAAEDLAREAASGDDPGPEAVAQARREIVAEACAPFNAPGFRDAVVAASGRSHEQLIDTVTLDRVIDSGPDVTATDRARADVQTWEQFIEDHRDEIDALALFFQRPYGERHVTLAQVRALAEAMTAPEVGLTPERLWDAYAQLERDKVRGAGETRLLADVVQLVRHAIDEADELAPHREDVDRRFHAWLAGQERAGRTFSTEQIEWLEMIRDHVAVNLDVRPDDLWRSPFEERGGAVRARAVFPEADLDALLAEINDALAA
ncbi:MAG: type I restriction-modification enzyme R subunit C-terminal domain-containing protein [Bacteroidota bacterium]